MKKLLYLIALFFIIAGINNSLKAQEHLSSNDKVVAQTVVKSSNHLTTPPDNFKEVNGFVLNRFNISFPDVTDDVWVKTNDGFLVTFTSNGIQNRAFLNKSGHTQGVIRYYTEKELQITERNQVKYAYPGFWISLVREVNFNNLTAYLVTLKNENSWKVVRIFNGDIDAWNEF